ncbi:MAG TPA: MFS transporter [Magnetospirillaceae bacterium]|jgi:EmrB/QacA subfamily drug resistance transporter
MTTSAGMTARRRQFLIFLVAGTFFMEMLDATVIVTALPSMATSFHRNAVDLNVAMTAYLLTLGVFIPVSGWVAERFGPKTVYGSAIVLFTVSSLLCAMSPTLPAFIAARILQGIGGAMMVPVGRLIVLRVTPKPELMRATATIVWPGLIAPVLGPPIGAFLTTYLSWPWIFYLNLPLGAIAFLLALRLAPAKGDEQHRPLDWLGAILSGAATVALAYGLDLLSNETVSPALVVALIVCGLILGVICVRHMRRHRHPLINLSVMGHQTFSFSMFAGSLCRIAIGTAPFLLPLMFQIGMGFSAIRSGTLVLAVFAGNLAMKSITTPMLRRFGFRSILVFNGILSAVSIALCGALSPDTPTAVIVILLFASGLFRSMQFTGLSTIAFADVPQPMMGGANALMSTVMQLTLGMGVAVGAVLLRGSAWFRGGSVGTPDLMDFRFAFVAAGVIALIGALGALPLPHTAGAEVSGHRRV